MSRTVHTDAWGIVTHAARECGVKRTTLLSAIGRDEVDHARLACGTVIVRLSSVRDWAGRERRPGRKPKPE